MNIKYFHRHIFLLLASGTRFFASGAIFFASGAIFLVFFSTKLASGANTTLLRSFFKFYHTIFIRITFIAIWNSTHSYQIFEVSLLDIPQTILICVWCNTPTNFLFAYDQSWKKMLPWATISFWKQFFSRNVGFLRSIWYWMSYNFFDGFFYCYMQKNCSRAFVI